MYNGIPEECQTSFLAPLQIKNPKDTSQIWTKANTVASFGPKPKKRKWIIIESNKCTLILAVLYDPSSLLYTVS